jgi:DNA-binding LacI/PurR family transcriptional regulator
MREAGLNPDDNLVHEGDLSLESGYILAHMLFNGRTPKVSAVFAGSDMMAIGVINHCREIGVRVPEDLSIVGFDGIPLASSSIVNLTTVQHPFAQMGQLVAERVFARINGDESSRQRITLVPKLVIRNSVAGVDR